MNGGRILIGEYVIAVTFSSVFAMKAKYAPWPGTLVKISLAFGTLGLLSFASEEFAALLGGGFLLAAFLNLYQKNDGLKNYKGGVPSAADNANLPYVPLHWGDITAGKAVG